MRYRLRTLLIVVVAGLLLLAVSTASIWAWMQYLAWVSSVTINPIPVPTPP